MALKLSSATGLFDQHLAAAARGHADAYFQLGIAFSTGTDGCDCDMIEAHKWFNLAALAGVSEAAAMRADVASDMEREEIAEAQRQARAWLSALSNGAIQQQRAA
jgi:TPR repeat protein